MSPAYLVDGLTEQRFIQTVCKNAPVKIINCNGNSVVVGAMAKRAASLIRLWGGRYYPIIMIVDREDREQIAEDFIVDLHAAIKSEGVEDELIIGVADRMIENWILGDDKVWGHQQPIENVDGFNGCSALKRLLPDYDKASLGPRLLKDALPSQIRARSASFDSFFKKLSNIKCHWLTR